MTWTPDGKSVIASYGSYGLRVKRVGRGRFWWVLTGMLAGRRQVKVQDGLEQCQKEGRRRVEEALMVASEEYRQEVVRERLRGREWFERPSEYVLQVGGKEWRVKTQWL